MEWIAKVWSSVIASLGISFDDGWGCWSCDHSLQRRPSRAERKEGWWAVCIECGGYYFDMTQLS